MERGQVTILLSPCQTGSNTGMNALKKSSNLVPMWGPTHLPRYFVDQCDLI